MASISVLSDEMLVEILVRIDDQEWLCSKGCSVCDRWRVIIESNGFWRSYHHHYGQKNAVIDAAFGDDNVWQYAASISAKYNMYGGVNLLRNASGDMVTKQELVAQDNRVLTEDGLMEPWPVYQHWRIWSSAGQGWKVQMPVQTSQMINPNEGCVQKTLSLPACFVTSHHSCTKQQVVDLDESLWKLATNDSSYEVTVDATEWYMFEGPCVYELRVAFLNGQGRGLHDMISRRSERSDHEQRGQWRKVHLQYVGSLAGVRKIKFYHGGTANGPIEDEQLQGHVGTFMGGASLVISYPRRKMSKRRPCTARVTAPFIPGK